MNYFLLGKSGVGKTTIIDNLCRVDEEYNAPPLLTTRSIRKDDDPAKIHSVSVDQYLKLRDSKQLYTDIDDGITYYGYLRPPYDNRIYLMYGSPLQIDDLIKKGGCILIERAVINIDKIRDETRIRLNEYLDIQYYKNPTFRGKVDVVIDNNGLLVDSVKQIEDFIKNN